MPDYQRQTPRERALALAQEFSAAITSSLVLEETLALIAQRTAEAVGAWECDLYEYDPGAETLTCTAFWSRDPSHADLEWVGTVVDLEQRQAYVEILRSGVVVEDHVDDPGLPDTERELMSAWGEMTTVSIPLFFRDEIVGCLVVIEKREARRFGDDERELLCELAVPAAIAIHNARMYRTQEDRSRQLSSLLEASRAITSSVVLEDVLDLVAENAAETLGSPECVIFEYDDDADAIVARSYYVRSGHEDPGYVPDLGVVYSLDQYPSDRAVLTGGTVIIEHASDDQLPADVRESMDLWKEKTVLTVPLLFHSRPLGMLLLIEKEKERQFSGSEIDLARGLAEHAALAIHNARLFLRQREQNERLVALLQVSQAITGSLNATEVVGRVTSEVGSLFPGSPTEAEVWLRVDDQLYLPFRPDLAAYRGEMPETLVTTPDEVAATALGRLGPVQVALDEGGHRLIVPLMLGARAEGYLELVCRRIVPFGEDEIQLVQLLVSHAAIALENADNYGRLETMYLETVTALAAAMEAKDQYTADHADMLATMAVSVGRRLGLSEADLRELQYAAVLHDIGKIGIPGAILNKPDKLTDDEFKVMTEHTIIGERIISRIEYLEPIAHIIRAAHERWDGGGYPDHIAGDAIPLAARILLVCDAYHAMTSDRPYRKALPDEVAIEELAKHAGTQFDPDVVDIFLNVHPDFEPEDSEPQLNYVLPVWKDRRRRPTAASEKKSA
jgi:HD-GYP domain-containing protein (c-di-GMP phosphodiesterase class II)